MDIQAQLRAAFAAELAEHLAAMRAALARADAGEAVDLRDLFRRAHSLKGASRAADLPAVEAVAHDLETLLDGRPALDPPTVETVRRGLDAIEDAAAGDDAAGVDDAEEAATGSGLLRISGDRIERLTEALRVLSADVGSRVRLDDPVRALSAELRAVAATLPQGGDAARRIAAAAARLSTLGRAVRDNAQALERAVAGIEGEAERIMLVPAATALDGLERMVRGLADDSAKQVALHVAGEGLEVDRRVLQRLRDPLTHILSNAIDHGIEPAGDRRAAGKAAQGLITIDFAAERQVLVVTIDDDGRGLDRPAIVARARSRGLVPAGAPDPGHEDAAALLFAHGLSTAPSVDRVSGRGVGLSVVAEAARALRGAVRIGDAPGGGTRLVLRVPLTLARVPVLLVTAGGIVWGIPADAVAGLSRATLFSENGRDYSMLSGEAWPASQLTHLLGIAGGEGESTMLSYVTSGDRRLALGVASLDRVAHLVLSDPSAIVAPSPLIHGTAILDDGRLVLILSPDALLSRTARPGPAPAASAPVAAGRRTILVVDDSITTRTLERSILEAQGYRVLVAVDGIDGLETLRRSADAIDLVIADVEMPRMDGFGLLAAIRNDPGLAGIPVVMMTSRNSPDDIRRGLDLGADAYQTKQDFDQGGLVATIARLV